MKIALTYDLKSEYLRQGYSEEDVAEFDRDETIASIEQALQECGFDTERVGNIHDLIQSLSRNQRWDIVFNIAEGLRGFGREAQIPGLLEAKNIPYTFSDPLTLCLSLDKGMTKRVIQSFNLPTAEFAVVNSVDDVASVVLPFPVFIKPVAEGTSKGVSAKSMVESKGQLADRCAALLNQYKQPVLVERYLSGREFTIGILGCGKESRAIGVLEVHATDKAEPYGCSSWNKDFCEDVLVYSLATDEIGRKAQKLAIEAWNVLRCRDAGRVDLRQDDKGDLYFLEVNPLPGLHPSHSDLPILCTKAGMPYRELIGSIVSHACRRNGIDCTVRK
ncbi:MAG: hypothetical protein JW795_19935 [Chitinivibrionales bacterium]|nr:hypothetical protein [Chitinivibrionales bacterium]